MKKIIFAGLLVIALGSCKNEVPSAPIEPPSVPANPTPSVPEKPKPENETAIQIGSDGVSVESKNGKNSTDVSIKDGKAAVDVKAR